MSKVPAWTQAESLFAALARYASAPETITLIHSMTRMATVVEQATVEAQEILKLLDTGDMADFQNLAPVSGMTVLALCTSLDDEIIAKAKEIAKTTLSARNKRSADIRHNRPGGAREKADNIRIIWASGKYDTRDTCAEQECGYLGMSFSSARKALRKTPSPTKKS